MSRFDIDGSLVSFIGMNTPDGFVDLSYDDFSGCDRLYVIKGGPGTGKSSLMKHIRMCAEERGVRTHSYLCSSDPTSLDGLIIEDIGVGFIDGTAPHTREAELPALRDRLINTAELIRESELRKSKAVIIELSERKRELYTKAYREMRVLSEIKKEVTATVGKAFLREKAEGAVERLLRRTKGQGFSVSSCQTHSFGMDGSFTVAPRTAQRSYRISDRYGTAPLFTSCVLDCAERMGLAVSVSRDPVCPDDITAIYLPDGDIMISLDTLPDDERSIINMERFSDADRLREVKRELKFLREAAELGYGALADTFSEIKREHFELERYYGSSMNFQRMKTLQKRLICEIFE